jgi:hypothetical protein
MRKVGFLQERTRRPSGARWASPHPSLRGALATKPCRGHSMRGAGGPDSRPAAPGWLRFADKIQTASTLISQGSVCHTRESGYPGATMRRRKSAPFVVAERVRLPERRGVLDSRVRGNDMKFAGAAAAAIPVSSIRVGRRPAPTRNDGKGIGSLISGRRLIRHRGRYGSIPVNFFPTAIFGLENGSG